MINMIDSDLEFLVLGDYESFVPNLALQSVFKEQVFIVRMLAFERD